MNYLIILLYSLSLILVWGLTLLDNTYNSYASKTIGLAYTVLSVVLMKNSPYYNKKWITKILFFFGAVVYLIATFAVGGFKFYSFIHPIVFAFILFSVSFIWVKKLNFKQLFFPLFLCYLYGFHLHLYYEDYKKEIKITKPVHQEENIGNFSFINFEQDTIELSQQKYIMLQTWNETCPPCKRAIKDLQPFLLAQNQKLDFYYLYKGNPKRALSLDAIFSYKHIALKEKILADIENRFDKKLGASSYPSFLFFDTKGNYIGQFKGYNKVKKQEVEAQIKELIQ